MKIIRKNWNLKREAKKKKNPIDSNEYYDMEVTTC